MASELFLKASEFLQMAYYELGIDGLDKRLAVVAEEIGSTGSYTHLPIELEHGARMAWRNSNRCIGRLFWRSLTVRDMRQTTDPEDIFLALEEHLSLCTNGGKIRPMITVFPPALHDGTIPVKILNKHLIRYNNDPEQVHFLHLCKKLGWQEDKKSYALLPVVIQCSGQAPVWRALDAGKVLEVPISHPTEGWFSALGLRWHAVPVVSDMILEIGGISYPCAPFNGWYMVTEIGARNFGDENRFNMLPTIAGKMGLDTQYDPFWRDKALVLLNEAVYHSYKAAGVSITDHHSASQQFLKFIRNEENEGREVNAEWSWIVPPMSGSTMPLFHMEFPDKIISPCFIHPKEIAAHCPFKH